MTRRRSVLAAASAVPLAAALPAPALVPPTAAAPLKILTMGDSLTNGYGDSQYGVNPDVTQVGYRRELSRQLGRAGVPFTMTNAAQNGGTTADLLQWARSTVAAQQPDLVVLAIGTNDAVQSDASLAAFENNYANLLLEIFYGWSPVKVCACFISYSQPAWMQPREKAVNDAIYRQAMPGTGPHGTRVCGVADWQILASYGLQYDGIHPTDAGYDVMGLLVYRTIAPWLGVS